MDLLLLIGVITLCATVRVEAGLLSSYFTPFKDVVCPSDDITFRFQTNKSLGDGVEVKASNLAKLLILPGPLKVMIHGYKGNNNYNPNSLLVAAYLKKPLYYNIITVEWNNKNFDKNIVGTCTARLLQQFYAKKGDDWKKNTHIIGFSLGAHAAGIVGYHIKGLGRITGLDPAQLDFYEYITPASYSLDHTDAALVDVYHSSDTLGTAGTLGDVDFYINNGISQPGCQTNSCSHFRSVQVFAESIGKPIAFYGKPCEDKVISYSLGISEEICPYLITDSNGVFAGHPVPHMTRSRTYRFETNDKAPFGKGSSEFSWL